MRALAHIDNLYFHTRFMPTKLLVPFDKSKTHILVSPFFKYISSLKILFNVKLLNFHQDLCFVEL